METQIPNVFAGGDAIRGADSLINAMADGQKVADTILKQIEKSLNLKITPERKLNEVEFQKKLAERKYGIEIPTIPLESRNSFDLVHPLLTEKEVIEEASRCLFCNDVCNICVTVCPNLANLSVNFETENIQYPIIQITNNEISNIEYKTFLIGQTHQIINIGDFCNECGNCDTFCPTSDAPYKTKPKFYLTEESFNNEDNCYLLKNYCLSFKLNNKTAILSIKNSNYFYSSELFDVEINGSDYSIIHFNKKTSETTFDLLKVMEMILLFNNLKENSLFN